MKTAIDSVRGRLQLIEVSVRDALRELDGLEVFHDPQDEDARLRDQLVKAIRQEGGAASTGILKSHVHRDIEMIRAELQMMEKDGVILRTGTGPRNYRWNLPNNGQSARPAKGAP